MASVEVRTVVKEFGPVRVLHGVDISIDDGEFVVLVAANPRCCG